MAENNTELCKLFEFYGADKCDNIFHTYSKLYYSIFLPVKEKVLNFLEIGIGTNKLMSPIVGNHYKEGASLRAWRDFFINATIYGIDIEKAVLFEEERIKCYYSDQSNQLILNKTVEKIFNDNDISCFDVILDDGSHLLDHMICSLNTLSKFLPMHGIYIVEDIQNNDMSKLLNNIPPWLKTTCIYSGNLNKAKTQDNFIMLQKIKQ